MKVLKIGIASLDEMRARTMAIARGELKPRRDDPKLWFTSAESIAKVLSESNRALLREIMQTHPQSLAELAERSGRKMPNLSRTLRTMASYGLVSLKPGPGRQIRPEVPYQRIEVMMSLDRARSTRHRWTPSETGRSCAQQDGAHNDSELNVALPIDRDA